jgi:hypothetical protein
LDNFQKINDRRLLVLEEFEKRYIPEPNSGCWLWIGSVFNTGYGQFKHKKGYRRAHVASYRLFKGKIQRGLDVRHTCDVRCCVNPEHLILGTRKQIVWDSINRGRNAVGEKNGASKLTKQDVLKIRNDTRSLAKIARDYDVHPPCIFKIKKRVHWRHI